MPPYEYNRQVILHMAHPVRACRIAVLHAILIFGIEQGVYTFDLLCSKATHTRGDYIILNLGGPVGNRNPIFSQTTSYNSRYTTGPISAGNSLKCGRIRMVISNNISCMEFGALGWN